MHKDENNSVKKLRFTHFKCGLFTLHLWYIHIYIYIYIYIVTTGETLSICLCVSLLVTFAAESRFAKYGKCPLNVESTNLFDLQHT